MQSKIVSLLAYGRKKISKKLVLTALIIGILFSFSSCATTQEPHSDSNENTTKSQFSGKQEDNNTQTTSPSFQEDNQSRISASCDKVLASGYDADQNFYELVANETEDYSGTKIEMGILKNNEWIIPLTQNSPFVSDTGLLVGASGNFKGSIYEEKFAVFHYIGAGCFIYAPEKHDQYRIGIIWNSNTGKYYNPAENNNYAPQIYISNEKEVINNDGLFLLSPWVEGNYKLLNVNTMKISDINLTRNITGYYYEYPFSEGLFAVVNSYHSPQDINGFYDTTGKKVIDLSQYHFVEKVIDAVFIDGKCTLEIKNDQGTLYDITIDKSGNVINSIQK